MTNTLSDDEEGDENKNYNNICLMKQHQKELC